MLFKALRGYLRAYISEAHGWGGHGFNKIIDSWDVKDILMFILHSEGKHQKRNIDY